MSEDKAPIGYFEFFFFDSKLTFSISLGSIGFTSAEDRNEAWQRIQSFTGMTAFSVALEDQHGEEIAQKPVDGEVCAELMGKSLADLVQDGRHNLYAIMDRLGAHRKEWQKK